MVAGAVAPFQGMCLLVSTSENLKGWFGFGFAVWLAVRMGIWARAGPVFAAMIEKKLRFGEPLVADFVRRMGETWPPSVDS
jgi:hypothetical protein